MISKITIKFYSHADYWNNFSLLSFVKKKKTKKYTIIKLHEYIMYCAVYELNIVANNFNIHVTFNFRFLASSSSSIIVCCKGINIQSFKLHCQRLLQSFPRNYFYNCSIFSNEEEEVVIWINIFCSDKIFRRKIST